jgi:hypothetical protein
MEEFKAGHIVSHKLSGTQLFILSKDTSYTDTYVCRYYNHITGLFVVENFINTELQLSSSDIIFH